MRPRAEIPLLATLILAGLSAATRLDAQSISGRLLDAESGAAVANATVTASDAAGSVLAGAVTGADGSFRLSLDAPATFRLQAQRIGYLTTLTDPLVLAPGATLTVEVRISTEVVPLDPVTVSVLRGNWWESERPERLWGLFERMDRYGTTGVGRFITGEDLERQRHAPAWMILTSPLAFGLRAEMASSGTTVRSFTIRGPLGSRCSPAYFLDGLRFRAGELVAFTTIESLAGQGRLEAIELFSPWYVPSELAVHLSNDEACVVAIWTRDPPS